MALGSYLPASGDHLREIAHMLATGDLGHATALVGQHASPVLVSGYFEAFA